MNSVLVSAIVSLVLTLSIPFALAGDAPETGALKLTSPVFENNSLLPPRYTCDGENINPPPRGGRGGRG